MVLRKLVVIVLLLLAVAPAQAARAGTTVSLTFDDAWVSQELVPSMLASHNMKATFYVNSNTVGTSGHMTWADVYQLANAGNEIAGHTLDHVDLLSVDYTEDHRQICDDRAQLM